MNSSIKNFLAITFLVIFSVTLFAATLRGVWGNPDVAEISALQNVVATPFESSHERAPYAQLLAFTQNNTFELSKEQADIASSDVGYRNGHFFSFFPPGVTFFILPFYLLGQLYSIGQLAVYFSMVIVSVGSLVLLYLISRNTFGMPISLALFVALTFGFATTSLSYAATLYQHALTTFLLLLAFYSSWKYAHSDTISWLWASLVGLSFGYSIFVDYPNAILMLPVVAYFLISTVKVINTKESSLKININLNVMFAAFFVVFLLVAHGYFNQQLYGSWSTTSQFFPRYDSSDTRILTSANEIYTLVEESSLPDKNVSKVFKEERVFKGLYILLFRGDKGLFFFSPVLIFALFGIAYGLRKFKLETSTLLGVAAINIMLYASFGDPWGGWAFGPRYLIPTMRRIEIMSRQSQKELLVSNLLFFHLSKRK